MLIPYNVDRQTRRTPRFTYGLMAVNVLVFFLTILTANMNLPSDKIAGKEAIKHWAHSPAMAKSGTNRAKELPAIVRMFLSRLRPHPISRFPASSIPALLLPAFHPPILLINSSFYAGVCIVPRPKH
jgi:hypothetical protein